MVGRQPNLCFLQTYRETASKPVLQTHLWWDSVHTCASCTYHGGTVSTPLLYTHLWWYTMPKAYQGTVSTPVIHAYVWWDNGRTCAFIHLWWESVHTCALCTFMVGQYLLPFSCTVMVEQHLHHALDKFMVRKFVWLIRHFNVWRALWGSF